MGAPAIMGECVGTGLICVGLLYFLPYIYFKLDDEHYLLKCFMFICSLFIFVSVANIGYHVSMSETSHDDLETAMNGLNVTCLWVGIVSFGIFMLYYLFVLFVWVGSMSSQAFKKWAMGKGYVK
jgi:hypothetical protein